MCLLLPNFEVVEMAKSGRTKRVSLSIPEDIWDDVAYSAGRMGVTRSALVSEMIESSIGVMATLLKMTPEAPTPSDVKRLRGASVDLIRERYNNTMAMFEEDK